MTNRPDIPVCAANASLVPFCQLADVRSYVACSWDLSTDPVGRVYWTSLFNRHIEITLNVGIEAAVNRGQDKPAPIDVAAI
jgi:hypothetical protein